MSSTLSLIKKILLRFGLFLTSGSINSGNNCTQTITLLVSSLIESISGLIFLS